MSKVCNFATCGFSLLVKHSPHWRKENNYAPDRHKIGMIVEKTFHDDKVAGVVCWPVVRWEGEVMGYLCHPANVVPYRKGEADRIGMIEIED